MGAAQGTGFVKAKMVGTFKGPLSERYEIVEQLGKGAQGAAYLVRAKIDGETYVAKETHDMTASGKADFVKEFEAMSSMHHPNCARVLELIEGRDIVNGEWKDQLFVISELACGSDLYRYMRNMLDSRAELTEQWVAGVYQQAMQGVAYMHSKGIVHNDLKPDNILVLSRFDPRDPGKVPAVVVNDFGCATLSRDRFFKCGDPRYQSPESWHLMRALMGGGRADFTKMGGEADVWSMGATLFELLSGGVLPFLYRSCTLHEILGDPGLFERLGDAILGEEVQIHPHCPEISAEAGDLLGRLLAKDPRQRISAPEALRHAWFSTEGKTVAASVSQRLHIRARKGIAHTVLLNALATKLQRTHYEKCWEIFQRVDADRSGSIGLDEFVRCSAELRIEESKAKELFQGADIDNDSFLDFDEFMAVTFDWQSLDQASQLKSLKKLFADLDTDGTGDLDERELGRAFQGAVPEDELRRIFEHIDADGSGRVSLDELSGFLFAAATEEEVQKFAGGGAAPPGRAQPKPEADAQLCIAGGVFACVCLAYHGWIKLW